MSPHSTVAASCTVRGRTVRGFRCVTTNLQRQEHLHVHFSSSSSAPDPCCRIAGHFTIDCAADGGSTKHCHPTGRRQPLFPSSLRLAYHLNMPEAPRCAALCDKESRVTHMQAGTPILARCLRGGSNSLITSALSYRPTSELTLILPLLSSYRAW